MQVSNTFLVTVSRHKKVKTQWEAKTHKDFSRIQIESVLQKILFVTTFSVIKFINCILTPSVSDKYLRLAKAVKKITVSTLLELLKLRGPLFQFFFKEILKFCQKVFFDSTALC